MYNNISMKSSIDAAKSDGSCSSLYTQGVGTIHILLDRVPAQISRETLMKSINILLHSIASLLVILHGKGYITTTLKMTENSIKMDKNNGSTNLEGLHPV